MAEQTKIIVFEETEPIVEIRSGQDSYTNIYDVTEVVKIFEPGLQGPKGERGERGYSGAGEPFYIITSGSLYGTTGSLAIFSTFSSSLIPQTSSNGFTTFNLGSISSPWNTLYVSESVVFSKGGNSQVTLVGGENRINIGYTTIETSSIGYDNVKNIQRLSSTQQTYIFRSGSVSSSFDETGILVLPEFDTLPTNAPVGGIIKSGNNIYLGI